MRRRSYKVDLHADYLGNPGKDNGQQGDWHGPLKVIVLQGSGLAWRVELVGRIRAFTAHGAARKALWHARNLIESGCEVVIYTEVI